MCVSPGLIRWKFRLFSRNTCSRGFERLRRTQKSGDPRMSRSGVFGAALGASALLACLVPLAPAQNAKSTATATAGAIDAKVLTLAGTSKDPLPGDWLTY